MSVCCGWRLGVGDVACRLRSCCSGLSRRLRSWRQCWRSCGAGSSDLRSCDVEVEKRWHYKRVLTPMMPINFTFQAPISSPRYHQLDEYFRP